MRMLSSIPPNPPHQAFVVNVQGYFLYLGSPGFNIPHTILEQEYETSRSSGWERNVP